eukprot:TRINITY_DN6072_c0_g1_i2.p1 TRINITY_DN6072_c0_g1~~TRINITY_DN6072_c0_g1_i2.p1  ORF type:complete len:118 (+),score=40.15 TRINITY_DN6072_c0_g1_i2:2-355(+)
MSEEQLAKEDTEANDASPTCENNRNGDDEDGGEGGGDDGADGARGGDDGTGGYDGGGEGDLMERGTQTTDWVDRENEEVTNILEHHVSVSTTGQTSHKRTAQYASSGTTKRLKTEFT